MNDGTIITDKIISDAKAEADSILAKANAEAAAITAKADKKAEDIGAKAKADAETEAEKIRAKEISAANMEASKKILGEKQAIINEVIDKAYKKLLSLNKEDYQNAVEAMLKGIPHEKCEIIVAEKDKPVLGEVIIRNGFFLSEEVRDIDGGFVVKSGDIEYNYSFGSILTVEEEEIRFKAAKILFG